MGLVKGPFVVVDTVSVEGDPYSSATDGVIRLDPNEPTSVATVDVCVKQPQRTQVSIDSLTQIAVGATGSNNSATFEVIFEIFRNGTRLALIKDEMDFAKPTGGFRHTNFPNFPLVDNNPSAGINTYNLRCTNMTVAGSIIIFVASRSLKATVITL